MRTLTNDRGLSILSLFFALFVFSSTVNATCYNVTDGGVIGPNQSSCGSFDPAPIMNLVSPSGGYGSLEYMWLQSSTPDVFTTGIVIPGATGASYDPGTVSMTTYFLRCSRRQYCSTWDGESNVVCIEVCSGGGSAPTLFNVPDDISVSCGAVPPAPGICNDVSLGYGTSVGYVNKVKDVSNLLGAPDGYVAEFWDPGDEADVVFDQVLPAGTEICITWRARNYTSSLPGSPTIEVGETIGGVTYFNTTLSTSSTSFVTQCFNLNAATNTIYLLNTGANPDWEVDAIAYEAIDCEPDEVYALDDGVCGSGVTITFNETTTGNLTTRTWTATDDCGNSTSESQNIYETGCVTASVIESCPVVDLLDPGPGIMRSLWFEEDIPAATSQRYSWVGGTGLWEIYDDGTARLTGQAQNTDDPCYKFDVEVWMVGPFDWTTWSGMGNDYKDGTLVGTNYLDWDYYMIDASKTSTLTGAGCFGSSDVLTITDDATDNYGVQVGDAANLFNSSFGVSMWFLYDGDLAGTHYNGKGDFNMNGGCFASEPPVANDDSGTTPEDTPTTICLPDNDTDADGDLDVTSVNLLGTPPASQGTVSLDPATGCITFTPAPDFCGDVDPFDYEISDGDGSTASATVTIHVTCVDDPPVANDDSGTTPEDTPTTICLPNNDSDVDGDLDVTSVNLLGTPPASQGTVTLDPTTGCITFTPAPDFCGTVDPFDYEISDMAGNTATATVNINVTCVDDAPVAVDDYDTTNEDTPVTVDLSSNDLDVDGDLDPSSVVILTTPPASQGTVVNNGDGTITFVPAPDFCGDVDPFDYQISDLAGNTATATVYIHVLCVDDAPVAVDDYDTTNEDTPVTVDLSSNDLDIDGDLDPSSVIILTTPPASQGTVINNGDGTITFVPAPDFCGDVDPFDYQISDLAGNTATATVYIHVLCVDDAPVAVDDYDTTNEDTPVIVDLSSNDLDVDGDLDPSSLNILTFPPASQGTVVNNGDGTITFVPAPDFCGDVDPFDYEISDMAGNTATATVFINVVCVDDAPVAVDDNDTTNEDTPVIVDLSSNDLDVDGDLDPSSLNILTFPPASQGTVINNGDGTITFVPAPDFCGDVDPFDYEISDLAGNTATATVYIHVLCVNDAPVAVDDYDTTFEDVPVIVDLASNDLDIDGDLDPSSVMILTFPPASQGTVINNGDGTITFVPAPGFCGDVDPFDYQISDLSGATATATVFIHVICVDDPPIALDDTDEVCNESSTTTNVLANDSDSDGTLDPTSVMVISGPVNGLATVNADGTITYIHDGSPTTTDSYVYMVADDDGLTATATVTITIYDALIVTGTTMDASCGSADGSVDITVMGGTGPYTYMWSNGETTEDISSLSPGTYTVSVMDANGCSGGNVFMVGGDDFLIASVTVIDATGCDIRDGGLIIDLDDAAAGDAPYFITVNGVFTAGPFATEPIVITGAPAGATATSIMVTDANGCTDTEFGPITVGGPVRPNIAGVTFPPADCGDLGADVIVDIDDTKPGTPPYMFVFNPGALAFGPYAGDPVTIEDVPFGSYNSITMIDASGCKDPYKTPFTLVDPMCAECPVPTNRGTIVNGGKTADLHWDAVVEALGYEIRIREAGTTTWINVPPFVGTMRRIGSLSESTTYEWEVRSICGTEMSDWSAMETFTTASYRDVAPTVSVEVYPNPASEQFSVNFSTTSSEDVDIYVYNQIGQLVVSQLENATVGSNTYNVSSTNLAAGMYEVTIYQGELIHTQKLVIQK